MAQEYTVLQFKKGDFQDAHGNYWCDMALEGVGEPVRIVVKDPMQYSDGMVLYGEVKEMTSKAGKPYNRFYREQRPDGASPTQQHLKPQQSDQYWEDKNSAIKAQWAIGQAVQVFNAKQVDPTPTELERQAKIFYALVDVVKAPEASQQSGYDKFKASKPTPKQEDDAETASLVAKMEETMSEPIDMSEIPF